ncbi:MAG TPA: glucose-6-phosphate dehydrogenase, partial [Nitrospirae bacterium]|nr:glucose-6-phosphate dehydrogenase [Nitrospirota bacterium]
MSKQASTKSPPVCEIESINEPFCIVIFGASGDLTSRKLIPSLFRLYTNNILNDNFFILGAARSNLSNEAFRQKTGEWTDKGNKDILDRKKWEAFSGRLFYTAIAYDDVRTFKTLAKRISALEKKHKTGCNRIFHLATPPNLYEVIIENLGASGLAESKKGFTRIVIEKP